MKKMLSFGVYICMHTGLNELDFQNQNLEDNKSIRIILIT